jgi:CelD/BcsL family acetyltransferase involved in cellulose biosynthesis
MGRRLIPQCGDNRMNVSAAERETWDALVRQEPAATFFQTPQWHELAEDFEGTRTTLLGFDAARGSASGNDGSPMAVLPLQARRRWWGTLLATPFGTYSGLLRRPGLTPADESYIAGQLTRHNLNLPGSPFSPWPPHTLSPKNTPQKKPPSHTHIIRLNALDPHAWVASWSRNHRRLLKTAQDTGAAIRLADTSADVNAYAALYRTQAKRWGSAARRIYPDELFLEIFRRFSADGSMKLWVAEQDGEIVAGRLCFYHGFHAVEWHAAALQEAMHKGINHLLVHAIVTAAQAAGHRVYDFNPNPGLDAVDHFKRGFATEALPFEGFVNRTGLVGGLVKFRDRLRGARRAESAPGPVSL